MKRIQLVMIGTSAGGVSALQKLFAALSGHYTVPIVVVQHLPADAKIEPAMVFGSSTKATIFEACDKMPIKDGHIYFAPPAYHLLIEKDKTLALTQEEPVHYSRPSIDVLFESGAEAMGFNACGILLTGANEDGANGLKCIQENGGVTVVQHPHEAEASAMPRSAISLITPNQVGTLAQIAQKLIDWDRGENP